MLALFVNARYIGILVSDMAIGIAESMCKKAGDVAELKHVDYMNEPSVTKTTYYHNGNNLITLDHTPRGAYWCQDCSDWHEDVWDEEIMSEEEEIQPKLRTSTYTKRLTGFKYNRSDAKRGFISRRSMKEDKRDINRAARRVMKEIIKEQLIA